MIKQGIKKININLDNNSLLLLYKLIISNKEIELEINIKSIWVYKKEILLKIFSLINIKKIYINFNEDNITKILILVIILGKINRLNLIYDFNFNLINPTFILNFFKSNSFFLNKNVNIIISIQENTLLKSQIFIIKIINLFKYKKFNNYTIKNIPYCFLLEDYEKIINKKVNIINLKDDCKSCSILNLCGWAKKEYNFDVFPIDKDFRKLSWNTLKYLSESILLANLNKDIENKYPVNVDLINNNFIWDKNDFFKIINSSSKKISLYIHIPFCISKCSFCCCYSKEKVNKEERKTYLVNLIKEINLFKNKLKGKEIKNIFFWWWTPSFYSEKELLKIFNILDKVFNIRWKNINITFEVTESTLTKEKIDFLYKNWVKNIFMWLQTSDKNILKSINRVQNIDRFIQLSKYIKSKWISLWIDVVVWLKWDNLLKLKNTFNIIKKIKPNSLQVCRFEKFWNISLDYRDYNPKFLEIFFKFFSYNLKKIGYIQSIDYDEIFYLDKNKLSTYDIDILKWNTDIIWFWTFAKSKIIDRLEWENNELDNYLKSKDLLFDNKSYIKKLNNWDKDRHYIISTLDSNIFNDELLNNYMYNFSRFKNIFFNLEKNWLRLKSNYNNRFYSKVIWNLFFDKVYFDNLINHYFYINFYKNNIDFYRYLWVKFDNFDNIYPIDPILDNITDEIKYNSWKRYFIENKEKKLIHIDKLGLYIHIPFCSTICSFCSCKTDTDLYRIDKYLDDLILDIEKYWKIFKWKEIKTIYFWWGTPWILNNIQIDKLFISLYKNLSFSKNLFISFEATPYSLNKNKLKLLKKYWVTRLSIWLQSLDDKVLENINRPQTIEYLYKLFKIIKEIKFKHINVDFVAWLKWETKSSIIRIIKFISEIKPDSIHLYQYYVDRSNSNEKYDYSRVKEIEKLFYFFKKEILHIWYFWNDIHDSVFTLKMWDISNLHDYNLYKYNNSVLALWEYSEWHIFGKLYYKNIKNWIIKWKEVNSRIEYAIYIMKNLEFWINLLEFYKIFKVSLLEEFKFEFWFLLKKKYIIIKNNFIYSKIDIHLDYITLYKIFWPELELYKYYNNFIFNKNSKINYNIFNSKPIK